MNQTLTFSAVIEAARKGGGFVTVPFEVEQIFQGKKGNTPG